MADKRIDELEEALTITSNDLFVLEQANTAKKLTGQTMTTFLTALAEAHGGIASIDKTSSSGTDPVIDTYTITYADMTTSTFNITNGLKGDRGQTGPQGPKGDDITISSASVQYQAWNSGTVYPTGTWLDNVPAVGQGEYLWTRTIVNYSDGAQTESYSVSRMGIDGSGAVSTVNSVSPDGSGNVQLTAADVGALPASYQAPVTSVNGAGGAVVITPQNISAASLSSGKVTPSEASSAIVNQTSSFTLALSDAGKLIVVSSSSDITITVPAEASVNFPIGTEIEVMSSGTGNVTFAGAGDAVLNSVDSLVSIVGQYGVVALKKYDVDTWILAGALS